MLPSMTVFLLHEVERFNKLLTIIRQSCEKLQRVEEGLEIISDDIERLILNIEYNKVPTQW